MNTEGTLLYDKIANEAENEKIVEEIPENKVQPAAEGNGTLISQDIFAPPDTKEQYEASKYSLRSWWISLQANKHVSYQERVNLYERALKYLPGCYKLWFHYLKECVDQMKDVSILTRRYEIINGIFERALIFMHKMPRIWIMYCEFLILQKVITKTRQTFDRALLALPATQHEKIWEIYFKWSLALETPRTTKSIIKRYLRINPDFKEEYVEYLIKKEDYDEAAIYLKEIFDDDGYASPSGKSKYQFVMELCTLIAKYPEKIKSLKCEEIIRHAIKKYTDEVGNLWISLVDFFLRQGLFEKARDTFEEALENVITARDFGIVFNGYVKFEEEMINLVANDTVIKEERNKDKTLEKKINKILKLEEDEIEVEDEDEDKDDDVELDFRMLRLEKLLERRPLLLNSCLLKQNPNNVGEWIKRLKIVSNNTKMVLRTYGEAINQIVPSKAENGKLSEIWISFANFYLRNGQIKSANTAFDRASKVEFKTLEEIIDVWTAWIEMLVKQGYLEDALTVVKQALFKRRAKTSESSLEEKVSNSPQLWALYIDLERNVGTFDTIKAAYKRALDLKVITPFLLINYACFLEENKFYEESFKVYETGLTLFTWPSLYEIWVMYLKKFSERYGGDRIERARDLFEKVLATVPIKLEERDGLLNHSIEILDRMVANVTDEEKMEAYNLYIAKVAHFLGVTKTRTIFESAIENLRGDNLVAMALRFSDLERKLGEIDRARAIIQHACQFTGPKEDSLGLWKKWEDFEINHGNIDTYKEYMRMKRSVLAKFSLLPPDVNKIVEKFEAAEKEKAGRKH